MSNQSTYLPNLSSSINSETALGKKQGLGFLWEMTQICLRFTDEKDAVRKIPIKNERYSTYFETHKPDGQTNTDA